MNKSDDVLERITTGERFYVQGLSEEVQAHSTLVTKMVRRAERMGYSFRIEADGARVCLNPSFEPSEAQIDRAFAFEREQTKRRKEQRRIGNPPKRGRPPSGPTFRTGDQPTNADYAEQERLAAIERVRAREEQAQHARQAAALGHTLALATDPGAAMLGVPLEATLTNGGPGGSHATPPTLGQGVQVFAMVLKDDGTLRMGLQTDSRRWVVDVVGEMTR